jgi:hypothetical protein
MHNPMKLHRITALLGIGISATSLAAEAFRVYAPASKTQTLWIVDALPKENGGLDLKRAEKRELGINGRVIAAHPKKPRLYIVGGGERGKVPGAVVTLAKYGTYVSHQRVDLNDDAAYDGATLTGYRITTDGNLEKAASLSWDAEISDLLTVGRP